MKDKELRKLIGSRAKQRRLELNLTQPYVAEKMGVRYIYNLWFILRHIKFFKFFLKIKSHSNLQNSNLSPSTYRISQDNHYHYIS